jgi:predicted permease
MDSLVQDVRFAIRVLRKSPAFTVVAVLTLALGIGANAAIFSLVRAILLQPLPYRDADRLVMIWNEYGGKPASNSPPDYLDRKKESRTLDEIAAFRAVSLNLSGTGTPQRVPAARVTASFFSTLGVPPELGRVFSASEDVPGNNSVVVLSHGCWQRRFGGDSSLVGRSVRLNGQPHTVVGVMPPDFNALLPDQEAWVPIAFTPQQMSDDNRGNEYLDVIARYKPQVDPAQVEAEMDAIAATVPERIQDRRDFLLSASWGAQVVPLREQFVGDARPALLVLTCAVGLVLLIACANVGNLLLARATKREREVALRAALGAGRGRIVRQLLVESVLLSAMGGAAGLLLAHGGAWLARKLGPATVPLLERVDVDASVLLFLLGVSVASGILFGLLPVLRLARGDLHASLKEGKGNVGGSGRQRLGGTLVVAEFAISLILLTGTGLLLRSLGRLVQVDPGFESENRLTVALSLPAASYRDGARREAFFRTLLARLESLPGVVSAGAVQSLPLAGTEDTSTVALEGRPTPAGQAEPSAEYRMVTPGYRRAMGIPLVKGRDFDGRDSADGARVMMVNELAARRFWPNEEPIGKRISFGDTRWYEVVGVTGSVRHKGLDVAGREQVYIPHAQDPVPNMYLVLHSSVSPEPMSRAIRQAVSELDGDLPIYDVKTMADRLDRSLALRRSGVAVLVAFASAALLLAAVGLHGVMAYSIAQRTREIGIRMALGAQRREVLGMVVGQGMKLALAGAAVGTLGALFVMRLLEGLLYGVKPDDAPTLVAGAFLLGTVALFACYLPARRATGVDPVVALRHE